MSDLEDPKSLANRLISIGGQRIADLEGALRECQSALAMMIAPDAIKQTTVINAYATAVAAEAKARSVLENGPAVLADATNDPASSDLSSLRKGAEVAAIMEMFGRWQTGYAFDDDNDDDVDLESRVEGEIATLVSGRREEQS